MSFFKAIITLAFLMFFVCFVIAAVDTEISVIMKKASKNENTQKEEMALLGKPEKMLIIEELVRYQNDSSVAVRMKSYELIKKVALKATDVSTREKGVTLLMEGIRDKDGGISGYASRGLQQFTKEDFNQQSREQIKTLLNQKVAHFSNVVRLAGFLEIKDAIPLLYNKLQGDSIKNAQVKWSLHLALARMGEEREIDYCVEKVKKLGVNDDVVYDLLPDLVYTRQPNAINYLVEILNSNDKNCEPADAELDGKILCGYRVLEYLAPIIEKFPLQTDASGDLKVKDYQAALVSARKWFAENPDYKIKRDTF